MENSDLQNLQHKSSGLGWSCYRNRVTIAAVMESGWGFELPYEQHLQPNFKILKNLRAVELELYVGDRQLNS